LPAENDEEHHTDARDRSLRFEDAFTFSETLAQTIDFAGPANYYPVLVGCISGARCMIGDALD